MANTYGNGGNGGNRAIVPANQAGTALVPKDQAIISALQQSDPALAQRAIRIMLSRPDKSKLSAARAISAAIREVETGQREGRDFFADEKMGNVDSARGVQDETARSTSYYTQYRPLTQDEAMEHEIQLGDTAIICEVYSPNLRNIAMSMSAPYRPVLGVGIVRKSEKWQTERWEGPDGNRHKVKLPEPLPIEPPTGKSWHWKAQQRALKDGLRHLPGGMATVAEVLEDAEDEGVHVSVPESARLDMEQAQRAIERERIAQQDRPHISLSGSGNDGYDLDEPVDGQLVETGLNEYDPGEREIAELESAAAFDAIPGATQPELATNEQVDTLGDLCKEMYPTPEAMAQFRSWMRDNYGTDARKNLTAKQASQLIESLKADQATAATA